MPYKYGHLFLTEAANDKFTHCDCCDPRRQLLVIIEADGISYVCPSSRHAYKQLHDTTILLPGVYLGALRP